MLGGFIKPTHLADFLERQPSLVNHSTNPSFEQGSGTTNVLKNYMLNPSFEVDTVNWTGGNRTATRVAEDNEWGSYACHVQPITTANSTMNHQLQASDRPLSGIYSAALRLPDDDPSESRVLRFRVQQSNAPNASYLMEDVTVTKEWQRWSFPYTVAAEGADSPTSFFVQAVNGTDTAPNGYLIDAAMVLDIQNLPPGLTYFDGSTNDFDTASLTPSWTGEANNSASVLTGQGVLGASSAYGNPVWLSSDNPNQGSKFARQLVKTTSGGSSGLAYFYTRDTSGTLAGERVTFSLNARINRDTTIRFQATPPNTNGGQAISGDIPVLANQWNELRGTLASQNWDDSSTFVTMANGFDFQPGDIIDIGKHFVVKGDYKGGWFSGTFSFSDANRSTMDNWRAWLRSQGAKGFNTHDLENQWLRGQGYTGTFADMFYAKFGDRDGARSFFKGD